LHPIECIIGRDSWGRGVHSRRWSNFGVTGDLLACLFFFIGVTEDDDVAITRRPKKLMIEFPEESSGELLIS
jgi:hypothetical protein